MFNQLSFDYRVYCFFLYDSGMRVTEANSIQIKNFNDDFTQVSISDEVAKTFGRDINLKLSSQLLKEFVKEHNLKPDDYLFQKQVFTINKYLRYHCGKLFGKDKISNSKSKGLYGNFTMYDIRHNSSCFWFNKYPTHKGLMYRFGWRKADKIEYYSEFLGVSDEITDTDMIVGEDKDKIFKLEAKIKEFEEKQKERIEKIEEDAEKKEEKHAENMQKMWDEIKRHKINTARIEEINRREKELEKELKESNSKK